MIQPGWPGAASVFIAWLARIKTLSCFSTIFYGFKVKLSILCGNVTEKLLTGFRKAGTKLRLLRTLIMKITPAGISGTLNASMEKPRPRRLKTPLLAIRRHP
jgi:hypothetical protein